MDEKLKKREKFCKIYKICIIVLLSLSSLYLIVTSIIFNIEEHTLNKTHLIFVTIGISVTMAIFSFVNSSILVKNIINIDNKTDIFIQKKEYNQGLEYLNLGINLMLY